MPSPVTTTTSSEAWNASTSRSFSAGVTRANTSWRAAVLRRALSSSSWSVAPVTGCASPSSSERAMAEAVTGVVAGHHRHLDPGAACLRDRGGRVRAERIVEPDQANELELVVDVLFLRQRGTVEPPLAHGEDAQPVLRPAQRLVVERAPLLGGQARTFQQRLGRALDEHAAPPVLLVDHGQALPPRIERELRNEPTLDGHAGVGDPGGRRRAEGAVDRVPETRGPPSSSTSAAVDASTPASRTCPSSSPACG